jgi:hypothetical protein
MAPAAGAGSPSSTNPQQSASRCCRAFSSLSRSDILCVQARTQRDTSLVIALVDYSPDFAFSPGRIQSLDSLSYPLF